MHISFARGKARFFFGALPASVSFKICSRTQMAGISCVFGIIFVVDSSNNRVSPTFCKLTPLKTNMDTQNDGLEKVTPFKYGHCFIIFGIYIC